ncbi:response regulator [Treponema sp.]
MAKKVVVCVDDEAIILLAMKRSLQLELKGEYRLETSTKASSALELIEEITAKGDELFVVISDWRMPGMWGDAFLRKIRLSYPKTCLILLTGYADRELVQALEEEIGLTAILQKPYSGKALAKLILEKCES